MIRLRPVTLGDRYPFLVEDQQQQSTSSWPLYLAGFLLFFGVLSVILWNVELPYLAWSAGPVSDAADAIEIDGPQVFTPDGELLMLTVISQDVNIFEAMIAGFDPTIDLLAKDRVRPPDETDEEYRTRILSQMDESQTRAITVAMSSLGYEMVPRDVIVGEIVVGFPADGVLELGDSVETVNGQEIVRVADVPAALDGLKPGDTVTIGVIREGSEREVEVTLAAREDNPDSPIIGVVVRELTDPPFPVTIDVGNIGGPSAGMMHALAIVDTLTPGELTKGRVIAGTGTIQFDGSVGNIGGIRQKVVGAEAAGASIILVPAGNYDEALTAHRNGIEIVSVATLEEALAYLEGLEPA